MNVEQLVKYFSTHKGATKRGVKETAHRTHSKVTDVIVAKKRFLSNKTPKHLTFPKILIFDIETAPMKSYVFKMWKENISIDKLIDDWFIICWSAKWLYSTEIMGECLTKEEILNEDDSRIVAELHKLFDEADILIAHNSLGFDIPKCNTRFLINDLPPTSPYKIIDTLKVAQKQFGFSSNKLDSLAVFMHLGDRKLPTDFNLWRGCMEGNQESLDYMFKYNKQDVALLEEVYLKLLPWIKNHPNLGVYTDKPVCSNCGGEIVLDPDKFYYTNINRYPVYRCKECGAYTRGRKSLSSTTLTTIAR
jgi:DNA-directed RNA polymerase subunit RPC12/RpoP